MILIEITNQEQLVKKEKGWIASKVGGMMSEAVEEEIEKEIIKNIQKVFREQGVHANILSLGGVNIRSMNQV